MGNKVEISIGFDELSVGELFDAARIGDPRCGSPIQKSTSFARGLRERTGKAVVCTGAVLGIVGAITAASLGGAYLVVEGGKFAHRVFNELPRSTQDILIISAVALTSAAYTMQFLPSYLQTMRKYRK